MSQMKLKRLSNLAATGFIAPMYARPPDGHLRHSKFVGLPDDKAAPHVIDLSPGFG
jgi:hypothetical protein